MPLTAFQAAIAELLAVNRSSDSRPAGGAARHHPFRFVAVAYTKVWNVPVRSLAACRSNCRCLASN
jgi:hypothetical protein